MKGVQCRLRLALLALALVGGLPAAQAATGRTVGSFTVADGAASYTIPIWTPPGPHGVQPRLALQYNSRQGGGPVGIGWSVAGLGSIYRCNLTIAQDSTSAAVTLSTSDGLCMNGSRLRLTGGTYAAAGSTYQTEIADFSLVTANGAAGNGPATFTVRGKDGLIYEYGNGGNSQVLASGSATAVVWMLDQVSDRNGNRMVVTYLAPSASLAGMTVPDTIQWTASSHGSGSFNYQVKFDYGTNVPQSSIYGYVAGTAVTNTTLLNDIRVTSGGTVIKQYVLTYVPSPTTSGNRLSQVRECADAAATNCLLPTNVTYQSGAAGVAPTATGQLGGAALSATAHHDFNGDGFGDIAYLNSTTSTWWVAFGSASGYGTPFDTGITGISGGRYMQVLFGDLLGSGKDGILAGNSSQTSWTYYTWNGSAFSGTLASGGSAFGASDVALADVNGDGLPDLVFMYYSSTSTSYTDTVDVVLNTSSTSAVSFAAGSVAYTQTGSLAAGANGGIVPSFITPDTQLGPLKSFDFNGDGLQDLAFVQAVCQYFIPNPGGGGSCAATTTTTYALTAQANGTFAATTITSPTTTSTPPPGVYFTNWNNDACTDVATGNSIFISGCNGAPAATIGVSGTIAGTIDWDGDGRADLLLASSPNFQVLLSTGAGVASGATSTGLPYSNGCSVMTFDADGDGLDDAAMFCPNGAPGITYYLHNQAGAKPDLLASISDGYLNTVSPSYVSIVRGSYNTNTGSSQPVFPYALFVGPQYVVNQVTYSDPSSPTGGSYFETYNYLSAWVNLQGRGVTNFKEYHRYDSRTQLWEVSGSRTSSPTPAISSCITFRGIRRRRSPLSRRSRVTRWRHSTVLQTTSATSSTPPGRRLGRTSSVAAKTASSSPRPPLLPPSITLEIR